VLSLLLDVGTQLEDVLLAGRLELVGETEIFDLDLWGGRESEREREARQEETPP